jgi:hypothetical protein
MKRFLFATVTTCALLALIPAAAMARHNHRPHHRAHARHARVRHEHFGTTSSSPSSGNTQGEGSQSAGSQSPAGTSSEAGTVQSFHNGSLTLMLRDGSTVTGQVTSATEMECEAADPNEDQDQDQAEDGDHARSGGGDHGDGRDHGAAYDQGDDQGPNDDADAAPTCPMPAQGDTVREAELSISSSGAVWQKLELVAPQQS